MARIVGGALLLFVEQFRLGKGRARGLHQGVVFHRIAHGRSLRLRGLGHAWRSGGIGNLGQDPAAPRRLGQCRSQFGLDAVVELGRTREGKRAIFQGNHAQLQSHDARGDIFARILDLRHEGGEIRTRSSPG